MSKILKVLLTVIAILLGLITLIILLLAIRPDLSGKLQIYFIPRIREPQTLLLQIQMK